MKNFVVFLLLFFTHLITNGQVSFSSIPENKQLIARDLSTNQGVVNINGSVTNGPYFDLASVSYTHLRAHET